MTAAIILDRTPLGTLSAIWLMLGTRLIWFLSAPTFSNTRLLVLFKAYGERRVADRPCRRLELLRHLSPEQVAPWSRRSGPRIGFWSNSEMPNSYSKYWTLFSIYDIITISYMVTEAPATVRARRLRERRSRGVAMVAPVEVGQGGVALLVSSGLLKEHQTRDRKAVGEACLAALEQWSTGRGARSVNQG